MGIADVGTLSATIDGLRAQNKQYEKHLSELTELRDFMEWKTTADEQTYLDIVTSTRKTLSHLRQMNAQIIDELSGDLKKLKEQQEAYC